jgi:hypothetical protein
MSKWISVKSVVEMLIVLAIGIVFLVAAIIAEMYQVTERNWFNVAFYPVLVVYLP